MVKAIVVSGHKESCKTTVVENLVKELVSRSYKIGTIKHVPQKNFSLDEPDTDTWRHARAGSNKVIALSPNEVATVERKRSELEDILLGLSNMDFVILEGFHNSKNIARMIASRSEDDARELDDEFTIGFVGEGYGEKPIFGLDESLEIANFVEKRAVMVPGGLDCGECGFETCRDFVLSAVEGKAAKDGCVALKGPVSLYVDNKRVPLKPFVQDLVANTLAGMVSSLKSGAGKKIELRIEKSEG